MAHNLVTCAGFFLIDFRIDFKFRQSGHFGLSRLPVFGAARLQVVMPVAAVGFFFGALRDYALPLYFRLLSYESSTALVGGASAYRSDLWSR